MKITKVLLIILFFTLPFIHGRVLQTLGIDLAFEVSWNFEFSKALFFNIFSSIIFCTFIVESYTSRRKILFPIYMFFAFIVLSISSIFSLSPLISILWDIEKWHTSLLFLNLGLIYLVLKNLDTVFYNTLFKTLLFSAIWISFLAHKEYFFPRFDYGALAWRALWSFGHPNYLAGFLLLVLPLSIYIQSKYIKYICIWILTWTIVFTQSIVAIVWSICYLIYISFPKIHKKLFLLGGCFVLIILWWLLTLYFPEKLHSFLSRFYIWESVLKIIFSDIKIFFVWNGLETLPYIFDSFKSPEIYIYENYWYSADRPHNFVLNIWYHFGLLWVSFFAYLLFRVFQSQKNTSSYTLASLVFFLYFWVFHFFSIASYIVIVLIFVYIFKDQKTYNISIVWSKVLCIWLLILSLIWGYYSYKLYTAEILYNERRYLIKASEIFPHPNYFIELWEYKLATEYQWFESQRNLKDQIMMNPESEKFCKELLDRYPSAENYFYCGNILENLWNLELSYKYYETWLTKLPDLWNHDSLYWDRYFVKHSITGNRFFSDKFSPLSEILEKFWK